MSSGIDYPLGETVHILFSTRSFSTGAPTTLAGTPVLSVYEDDSVTQITAGVSVSADHDSVTGLNLATIVATSGNGYESGKSYHVVITTGTVGGVSVVGEVVGSFSIERGAALRPTTAGRTLDVAATGEAGLDFGNVTGTLSGGQLAAGVFGAAAIRAADIATDAITSDKIAANAIGSSELATDAIGAAQIAANAIGSSELATTAVNEIRDAILADSTAFNGADIAAILTDTGTTLPDSLPAALTKGTADSGTTTTMVDAALTEADTDYWAGNWIRFTSGTISGQTRLITGFTPASDTITFDPATTQAVGTNTYEILPAGATGVDWGTVLRKTTVNDLSSTDTQAVASAVSVFTDGISAASLATDAVNEIRDAILADSTAFNGANIDAAVTTRATPAQVNTQVLDVLNTDTFAEPGQGTPAATTTLVEKIGYLYKFLRNRVTVTSSTISVYNDDATTVDHKSTHSDDTATYDRGEYTTGP